MSEHNSSALDDVITHLLTPDAHLLRALGGARLISDWDAVLVGAEHAYLCVLSRIQD